jgi:hypothetical protein
MIRWDGYSIYHAGTFKIEKRGSGGLTFDANYTWSKSIDDASLAGITFSETNIPQDVRDVRAERALSSFDHRHRFVFSYSDKLPFQHRGRLLQGWTMTGLGSLQSGAPFTVILPTDNANIGAGPTQRPNLIADPNVNAPHTAQQWFNTAAFQMPSAFTFGSSGRNVVFAAPEKNLDVSLSKEAQLKEKRTTSIPRRSVQMCSITPTSRTSLEGRPSYRRSAGTRRLKIHDKSSLR